VTEIRRSRNGRPSVSVTIIAIILPRGGSGRTGVDGKTHAACPAEAHLALQARRGPAAVPVELGAVTGSPRPPSSSTGDGHWVPAPEQARMGGFGDLATHRSTPRAGS
jgi:hypothetical protein